MFRNPWEEIGGGGGFATRAIRFFQCYITPAFSGVPNKGDKIRTGCLTPAFYHPPPCQWPGPCFFFREGGGGICKGGHVSSFKGGGVH